MINRSEEQKAFSRKIAMIQMLPLEEAMTFVTTPLYGLTEEVYGLQHCMNIWQSERCMKLEYYSPRYKQYETVKGKTFTVESHLYDEETKPKIRLGGLPNLSLGGAAVFGDTSEEERVAILNDFSKRQDLRHHVFIARDVLILIDGKSFRGCLTYFSAPFCYSAFTLYSGRVGVEGEALGPSIEELIQILESLRVLNGKAVE